MGAHVALDHVLDVLPAPIATPAPLAPYKDFGDLDDPRFRDLLPPEEWASLPTPVRRRFSKRLAGGATTVYAGEVLETRMNLAGWLLAQAARLIGGPLPLHRCAHVAAVVAVSEDKVGGGQVWTRIYARRNGFPQVVHSAKRFAGPTALEEYLGRGFGIALDVYVREGVLIFRSAGYFLKLFGRRFMLPAWLSPGVMYVTHAQLPDQKVSFTLQLLHPRLGLLVRQMAVFRETVP